LPKQRRPVTWIEVAVKNGGFRKGNTALVWATCWAIVREVNGQEPSVEEVADWWKTPYRTAYREQAAFRAAFPMLDTPARIFESPESRARLAKAAQAALDSDAGHHSGRGPSDLGVLEIGLAPAAI